MNKLLLACFVFLAFSAYSQNTIGLPRVVNYSKTDFHGGSQTWDIKQDSSGKLFFANNEGLLSFDGTYWRLFPLPNRTIVRSLALDGHGRIYVGGQGEIGYFEAGSGGFMSYHSLIDLLPANQRVFADVWDIEVFNESVFFRASDRIFQYTNNSIKVYPAFSEWVFLKKAGNKLFVQDIKQGLFQFRNRLWQPVPGTSILENKSLVGILQPSDDSLVLASYNAGFFLLNKNEFKPFNTISAGIATSGNYNTEQLGSKEFVVATTSDGCLVIDFRGNIVQRIARTEGLQNNNVLCVFQDRDKNLWAGLNNGISFIAYNSAIKYIRPGYENELSGFSANILNNQLYIATSGGAYQVPLSSQKDLSFSRGDFRFIPNSQGQVWRIAEVNGKLLMAHTSGTYAIEGGIARQLTPEPSWLFLPATEVMPAKDILAGTYTGLRKLEYDGHFIDKGNLSGTYESFRFLEMDNEGRIWSSHPYRGIYQIQLSPDRTKYLATLYTEKDGLPSSLGNHVFRIKNRVVFATEKGAYEFDAKEKRFRPSSFLQPLLGTIELRYLNEDADGNIWFCSGKKLGVIHGSTDRAGQTKITYFPELTGQILSGFEYVYPYNDQNIFIASEKGLIHLNFLKYRSSSRQLVPLMGDVRATGNNKDSILFGGYQENLNAGLPASINSGIKLPNRFSSFHFEYSCPAYGLQSNIEYSYKLEGFDQEWSAWSTKTEKSYTNLSNGEYTFMVKARSNLSSESLPASYSFYVNPPWYKSAIAFVVYALLLLGLVFLFDKWQKKKLLQQRLEYEEKQRQINIMHQLEIEKNEKEIIKLQNEKLANEMMYKNRELADTSLHLVESTNALSKVKEELQKLYKEQPDKNTIKRTIRFLNDMEKNEDNWDKFSSHFDEVNNDLLKRLKSSYPQLTNTDLRICAYLQLNLSSKEIAQLINISLRGVEIRRYRLRKKLQIPSEQSLNDFLNNLA